MSFIVNVLRASKRLIKTQQHAFVLLESKIPWPCSLCNSLSFQSFHTTASKFKREYKKPSVKIKSKLPMTNIWKNMTPLQIAEVTNRPIDDVFEVMDFDPRCTNIKSKTQKISDVAAVRSIVKMLGFISQEIKNPEKEEKKTVSKDAVKRPPPLPEEMVKRPPVVTIMGHVDHGKTTLLDALRKSSIVSQEFGGITQHIGAFTVKVPPNERITFLDTPGHAAFSAMRARGARATDLVVLVVAADDGVMDQTIESIKYAQDAQVPIIVAINKIDKGRLKIDALKHDLCTYGIYVEDLGGQTQAIEISALKGINLDLLVQAILIQAEVMEIKGDPKGPVEGVVIESTADPLKGKIATVLVQRGTLKKNAVLVAGEAWGRVRMLLDENSKELEKVPPGNPAQVHGWKDLPGAGDLIIEVESPKRAKEVVEWRKEQREKEKAEMEAPTIIKMREEQINAHRQKMRMKSEGTFVYKPQPNQIVISSEEGPKFSLLLKGDVAGSVEALLDVLSTYNQHHKCKLDIVDFGVGPITKDDLEMAKLFDGIIYAFNVPKDKSLSTMEKEELERIRHYNVIYHLIDNIKDEINNRLPKVDKEEEIGRADVLAEFIIYEKRKKFPIAGCRCTKGTLLKKDVFYKLMRNENTIAKDLKVESLRHVKDEVNSIDRGVECGLRLNQPELRFQKGDVLICYRIVSVDQFLEWNPGF